MWSCSPIRPRAGPGDCAPRIRRQSPSPVEEGYPAYLGSRLMPQSTNARAVSRAAWAGGRGSVALIGVVTAARRHFSEPVTSHTEIVRISGRQSEDWPDARHFTRRSTGSTWLRAGCQHRCRLWSQRKSSGAWSRQRARTLSLLSHATPNYRASSAYGPGPGRCHLDTNAGRSWKVPRWSRKQCSQAHWTRPTPIAHRTNSSAARTGDAGDEPGQGNPVAPVPRYRNSPSTRSSPASVARNQPGAVTRANSSPLLPAEVY